MKTYKINNEALKRIRGDAGLSMDKLAECVGYKTAGSIGHLESGFRGKEVKADIALRLVEELNKALELKMQDKIQLSDLFDIVQPGQHIPLKDPPDPCPDICKKLKDVERETLAKYVEIPFNERKQIWLAWDNSVSEAQKKDIGKAG